MRTVWQGEVGVKGGVRGGGEVRGGREEEGVGVGGEGVSRLR